MTPDIKIYNTTNFERNYFLKTHHSMTPLLLLCSEDVNGRFPEFPAPPARVRTAARARLLAAGRTEPCSRNP